MTADIGGTEGSVDRFKKTYFEECAELIDAAYMHLGELAEHGSDDEAMNAVFRAVHSIKGGAGAFGFNRLVGFAHKLETLLDNLRSGRMAPEAETIATLLRATDVLSDLIEAARLENEAAHGLEDEVTQALQALVEDDDAGASASETRSAPKPLDRTAVAAGKTRHYRIRFVPRSDMFQKANEPLLVIRALKRLGTLTIAVDLGKLPDLVALEAEDAYLGWTIELDTDASRAAIEELFEFVVDDCELTIEATSPAGDPIASEPSPDDRSGDVSVSTQNTPDTSGAKADHARSETPNAVQSIRVDVEKVDRVVNLVGELVINQAMLHEFGRNLPPDISPGLVNGLETLSQQLRELQESVMAIRAQPVKSVFSRMPRLVREVAAQLGKEVRLAVSGEGTEIDKTVIEQLADPLTHLLRNALDHGIEPPDEREAQGKPRQGTIHLGAQHRSGRVVIEISDDGRGIDRVKVLASAQKHGLAPAGVTPTEEEIDNLIFLPSLSTAEGVSNISGRGVGLDVVKRNMQSLGGRVSVESNRGVGSRFLLSLPLTLAVLDGLVVSVGGETYIIPLANIVESLRPKPADIHAVVGRGDVLALRGVYVPLIYLHRRFTIAGTVTDPCHGMIVIVESEGDGRVGLVVDELVGQQQVVVKSLETNYDAVEGISGATILGDGRVALILDVAGLHARAAMVPTGLGSATTPQPISPPSSIH